MTTMVPEPEGRRPAPLWVQVTLVLGCVAVLGGIAIASLGAWSSYGKDEARCMIVVERLLGNDGSLGADARKAVQAEFDRCKELGTITAEDVENYLTSKGLSQEDA